MTNKLSIQDLDFVVVSASIDAFVDEDSVAWGLSVAASGNADGAIWKPKLSSEVLFRTPRLNPRHWYELAQSVTHWTDPENEEGEPRATIHVFSHAPLYECTVSISCGPETETRVVLAGLFDLLWKPGYTRRVPLHLDTSAEFAGVLCGRRSSEDAAKLVAPFLVLSDLEYRKNAQGVATLGPKQ